MSTKIAVKVAKYGHGPFVACLGDGELGEVDLTGDHRTPIAAARDGARKLRGLANALDRQADRGFKGKWGRTRP